MRRQFQDAAHFSWPQTGETPIEALQLVYHIRHQSHFSLTGQSLEQMRPRTNHLKEFHSQAGEFGISALDRNPQLYSISQRQEVTNVGHVSLVLKLQQSCLGSA